MKFALAFFCSFSLHLGLSAQTALLCPSALQGCSEAMLDLQAFLREYSDDKVKRYVEKYQHIAIAEMGRSGIPASIKMAQGILESAYGESELATKANNHFGIKCGGVWTGPTYHVWDDEPQKSCFRVFSSAEECYIAHTEFLLDPKKTTRYGFLFEYAKTDYRNWAEGLQKAGYATSKTYAVKLIALIERHELYKLDYLSTEPLALNETELQALFPEYYQQPKTDTFTHVKLGNDGTTVVFIPDPFGNQLDSVQMVLSRDPFLVNGLKTVHVHQGDNFRSLAKRYKLKESKLLKYNEAKGRVFRPGQFVFLQKKKKRYTGQESAHPVRQGQSLYDIAQHYGLRYQSLLKLNPQYRQQEPKAGDKVWLKKP